MRAEVTQGGRKMVGRGEFRGLPPGPRMPSAMQAIGWSMRPLAFLERCGRDFGHTFTLRVRHDRPWVVLTEPEDVKRVFTADADAVTASAVEASPALGPLLGPRSVMLLDEPEHMTHRKLMLRSFHGERLAGYGDMVVAVTRDEISRWPMNEQLALWPRMQAISSEVLLRSVFGDTQTEHMARLRERLSRLTAWLNDSRRLALTTVVGPRWLSHNAGFRAVMAPVEADVLAEVRRRRATPGAQDSENVLAMLERAHAWSGSPLSEPQLRDELITLLSDGPTSTSLAWAFERLLRHPDKLARVQREVLTGQDDAYAEAVVKETLRLCPVVPLIMRKLLAPMQLGGCTIPAGATAAPCPYLIHRREDIYPNARAFVPERFLGAPAPAYAWIPFGGGVRRCLAASFAQLTIKRVIQTVLSELDVRPAGASRSAGTTRSSGATRSSVAFLPGDQALAIVTRRTGHDDPQWPGTGTAPRLAA
jgi:cytochrome P450